jgi:hypothetical protein
MGTLTDQGHTAERDGRTNAKIDGNKETPTADPERAVHEIKLAWTGP